MKWGEDFRQHAQQCLPLEACGLLVLQNGVETYIPCTNAATDQDHFLLPRETYDRIRGQWPVVAVCHSHPQGPPGLSEFDLGALAEGEVAWYVLDVPTGAIYGEVPPSWKAPLLGRPFIYGTTDCYTLVRDYYAREHKIYLPEYRRKEGWEKQGLNLYAENFEPAGFLPVPLGELRPGDALLMQIHASVPNHAAIYIGDNQILHHLLGRLSSREVYGGYYRKVVTHALRHRCLM